MSNSFSSGNSSSQVVELFDTTRAQNDLYRIFNPSIGSTFNSSSTVLSFGFQYLYDGIASTSASSLRYGIGEMGSGQQILRIELVSNGKLNFNDGTSYITVKNAQGSDLVSSLDQWITISGIADYSTNTYTLFVNGVQQVGSAGTGDFNMNFFSTANKTSVLNFFAMGSTGATYAPIYLDNVSLQAVPEPATALLVGLACGVFVLSRRRRS
ncbi:MAG: PEP-CTERM sorting domain-containing protein [Verrucomicrobia bacterium]|nr:PEP-CTERM sorting domain-containing protein [Verrucomicrobiota bacterium]